ncbi:MAG: patatin-like phospholipase family protein [Bryobacterales bacterium]|nr:patatin-like phospholipase family protein [Bryobacterales bacterium]
MKAIAVALLSFSLLAQPLPPLKPRPKVGLALAGGSALGFAHIGVLSWLEEHRIPVDFIAGTSMGGLVGGMYATGASATEIRTFLQSVDWDKALLASAPFRQLHFRRKEDRRAFPNRLELGLRGGLRTPSALSPAHGVGLVLSRFAAHYSDLPSFNDLPIPFRCVAVDLDEGHQVVFDRGDLFTALRATIAIPGLFTPVRRNNQVLVDGGVVNNLPVDVVRDMGADAVIAVALHAKLPNRKSDYSILEAVNRSIDVMIATNERRSLTDADVALLPDLDGIFSTDFKRAADLIERGYRAAAASAAELQAYSIPDADYRAWRDRTSARRRPAGVKPQFVAVQGLTPPLARDLERRLQPVIAGGLDQERLDGELTRLTGLGRYQSARYRYIEREGRPGILIDVQEKRYGPPFLNTVIELDGSSGQDIQFGIGGRLILLDKPVPGAELRADFGLGTRDYLNAEYFRRLRGSKLFVAPQAFLTQRSFDLFSNREPFSRADSTEAGLALDAGYAAGRFTEYRLGYQFSRISNTASIPSSEFRRLEGATSRLRARFIHEGQDSPVLPTQGIRAAVHAQWIFSAPGAEKQFPILDLDLRWATRLNRNYVFQANFAAGTSASGSNYFSPFFLGGAFRLAALARDQMIGNRYYFTQAALLRRIREEPTSIVGRLYLITAFEAGRAYYPNQLRNPFFDGAAGLISETGLGVLFFGAAAGEGGERKIFFRLGRYF